MGSVMNSQQISEAIYNYALNRKDFTAPYGVIQGELTNKKGTKYKAVTFGKARKLDATVEIYNRNFMILRTSTWGSEVFRDVDQLFEKLKYL